MVHCWEPFGSESPWVCDPTHYPSAMAPWSPNEPVAPPASSHHALGPDSVYCKECQKWVNGPRQYEDHKKGEKHQKNLQKARRCTGTTPYHGPNDPPAMGQWSPNEPVAPPTSSRCESSHLLRDGLSEARPGPDAVYCKECQTWVNGPRQYKDHEIGKKRRKNVQKQRRCTARLLLICEILLVHEPDPPSDPEPEKITDAWLWLEKGKDEKLTEEAAHVAEQPELGKLSLATSSF